MSFTFNVPTEALSSLIGYKGKKLKDTELQSRCKIRYIKQSEELSKVLITGLKEHTILLIHRFLRPLPPKLS